MPEVNISEFCIKRPVFTMVLCFVLIILGAISFWDLPVGWIPNINPPVVSIETSYPGASAKLVEQKVTKVLEGALSGINGIEVLNSTSMRDESQISISFKLGVNMNAAVEDVRSAIERVRSDLPRDVLNPTVSRYSFNDNPIMYISFLDANRSPLALSDYINKFITPTFEALDGVGQVYVYGKRTPAVRILLDPARMAGANIAVDEVSHLLQEQNAAIPSGQIKGRDRNYTITLNTALNDIQEFNNLIIRDKDNRVLRLRDIGEAKLEAEHNDSSFRINSKTGVALAIIPQSNANPLVVESTIKNRLKEVVRGLPPGMKAEIIYNQADYIRSSINSVYHAFFEAIIFVWIVIYFFLRNFCSTLIPIVTIPICLIATFIVLRVFNFSINTISLMAFVLAIGLVVDDAIVMLENITRQLENGMTAFAAAISGSYEIIFSIVAMTITLAAVYTPVAYTPGILGLLFREFTFTLAGAVIISGLIALTLTPMMCSRILKPKINSVSGGEIQSGWLYSLQRRYQGFLLLALQQRKWVIGMLCVIAVIGGMIYYLLPSELAPSEDMGVVYLSASAPKNASFHYTDNFSHQIEALYRDIPEISSYLSITGGGGSPSNSFHVLVLKPKYERKLSANTIAETLTPQLSNITGIRGSAFSPPPPLAEFAGEGSSDTIRVIAMTSGDYDTLKSKVTPLMEAIKAIPGVTRVDNSLKWDSEQFQLTINRARAADLMVPVAAITNTISTMIAGRMIGKTDKHNIILQMNEKYLADPNVFQQLYVKNEIGNIVPITSMVDIANVASPEIYRHFDRLRADTIYVSLSSELAFSKAVQSLQKIMKKYATDDIKLTFTGEARSFLESQGKSFFTFILAIVFIYLVLAAQFESFIDPFIIILTVPFAVVGAMLTLKLFGGSLNIYSNIGLITLVGLISKHGILITDFANRLRAGGATINDAVVQSAMLRLRPILMTTAAMILGAMPLAFSQGPGAESRQQIGLVIAGGLFFGTFFSLIVIPIAYSYLSSFRKLSIHSSGQGIQHASIL